MKKIKLTNYFFFFEAKLITFVAHFAEFSSAFHKTNL